VSTLQDATQLNSWVALSFAMRKRLYLKPTSVRVVTWKLFFSEDCIPAHGIILSTMKIIHDKARINKQALSSTIKKLSISGLLIMAE
jgi:hypothetical protein